MKRGPKKADRVWVSCPDCSKVRVLLPREYQQYVYRKSTFRCRSCAARIGNAARLEQIRAARILTNPCRHCRRAPINRPRQLCHVCYYTPEILALYPPTSKYARRGAGIGMRATGALPTPRRALPATARKVAVMMERAARGLALFHPQDGQRDLS